MRRMKNTIVLALGLAAWGATASPGLAYEEASVANGAAVSGTVRFTGTAPEPKLFELWRAPDRAYCGAFSDGSGYRVLREVVADSAGGLKDVVITIEGVVKGKPFELKETRLDASVCQFLPFVSVVRNGHPMTVTNLDPVSHDLQVYERDEQSVYIMFHRPSLTRTGTTDQIRFTASRREMTMQCGMHPFMQAHGLAVDSPYYAISSQEGTYRIPDLPPGAYRIRAWHPLLGMQERQVAIKPNETIALDWTFPSR